MHKKNSLLWEIHKDNVFKGYLFGTMHIASEIAFDSLEAIRKAIDSSDQFATEIPLDSSSQQEMGKHMNFPESVALTNLLSEKKYQKYSKILKKSFNLELSHFNNVLPLFLLNYLTQIALNAEVKNMNNSMDLEFWNYAKLNNKELVSVESLKDHVNTLYSIPLEYQLKALKDSLSNVSKFRRKTLAMLDLYRSQDIHKLYATSKKSLGGIKDVLLYERNITMVKNIVSLSSDKSLFVAVGAGHLSGKKGLIHLLKSEGYMLTPTAI